MKAFPQFCNSPIFLILIFFLTMPACMKDGSPEINDHAALEPKEIPPVDGSYVPQTLVPSRVEPLPKPPPAPISTPGISKAKIKPPQPIRPKRLPQAQEQLFGEYVGIKTKWQEMHDKLTKEIQEEEQKVKELKFKRQLIQQISNNVNFKTQISLGPAKQLRAKYIIENRTPYTIKDVAILCDQIAPTGTVIESYTETLYAMMAPQTRSTYSNVPLGIKHRQTKDFQCQITNFTIHNQPTNTTSPKTSQPPR